MNSMIFKNGEYIKTLKYMTSTMMVVNCKLIKVGLKHHVTGLQPSYENYRNLNAACIQGCHGNKVVLECQCYFRLGFVVILVIDY